MASMASVGYLAFGDIQSHQCDVAAALEFHYSGWGTFGWASQRTISLQSWLNTNLLSLQQARDEKEEVTYE